MVSVLSYSLEIFSSAISNITLLHSLLSGIIIMHILDFPISYMALSFSPIFSMFLSLYMHLFNFFLFSRSLILCSVMSKLIILVVGFLSSSTII
jgi:hypothetical protein